MVDLAKRQVVWSIIQWLKKEPQDDGLDVVMQCLSEHYDVAFGDPQQKKLLDLGLDLEEIVKGAGGGKASAEEPPTEQKLSEFIEILRQKGYFNGVEEGTPAYQDRYEKARQKFNQRNNPYEGLSADQLKTQGNQKMTSGNYREAVGFYTKAIELDPKTAIYYANRAAAYTHLKEYKKAIVDCEKSIAIDPNYSKAYSRFGTALFYDGNYAKAVEAYAKAVELDPENEGYKADLKAAEEKLKEVQSGGGGAGAGGGVAPWANPFGGGAGGANPFDFGAMSSMLSNPEFMNMAQNIMKQPQFAEMMQNMAGQFGGGAGGAGGMPPMPDFSQLYGNLAQQQTGDGTLPDTVKTPFGELRREQLEALQNNPDIKDNPKFQAIMEDVRTNGPLAMMKYMNDPEIMSTMTKMAGQLFGGQKPPQ